MNKIHVMCYISFICLFAISANQFAQSKSPYKYGRIDMSELKMLTYPADTAASAVVLFHDGFTDYDYVNNKFVVRTYVNKRVKILKQAGMDKATITLRYYYKNASMCENISGMEAYAYNLEGGKTTKTKLENKYIFNERINDYYKQIKFAIPNVKVGTVIEYKYVVTSDFYYDLPNWYFQSDIPVVSGRYQVLIPEYFVYNIESRGYEQIKMEEKAATKNFTISSKHSLETVSCLARDVVFTVQEIPALKEDNYIWTIKDFLSSLRFELSGTRFPYELYKNFTRTWDDIEKTLKDNSDFEKFTSRSNPFSKETASLCASEDDEVRKIENIYQFVKNKIRWNESYSFVSNPSEAIRNGTGDNAQINSILISILKEAGIKAYPVMMSRRSLGRLPLTYPSIDQLNTFIVMAETSNGERYFMDGSAFYGGLNMLPTDLLVDKARIFGYNAENKWIDLTMIAKNQFLNMISAKIDTEGNITGHCNRLMMNQPAYHFKKMYNELQDTTAYVDKLNIELSVEIDSVNLDGHKDLLTNKISQHFNFKKTNQPDAEYLYINPLIFAHFTKNDFTQSDRKLPIEFNYPYKFMISANIELPDNYTLEEIPRSEKFVLNDNCGFLVYLIKQINDKMIQVNYRFELNSIIFPQTEYEYVKTFWGQVAAKNNELIVLKKI